MRNFVTLDFLRARIKNREIPPEEIFEYGFVPPVQTPDGQWQAGDELAANWLNWLLNDLYKGAVTQDRTPATPPANMSGYFAIQVGDILIQGGNISGLSTVGNNVITFPVPFVTGSQPLVFAMPVAAAGGTAPIVQSMSIGNPANTGLLAATANTIVAPGTVNWMAIGHAALNVSGVPQGFKDLRTRNYFCRTPMSYPDSQDNLSVPPALTVAQGYAPPHLQNGLWIEGDGLPAPELNFLFQSLYSMPSFQSRPSDAQRRGSIDFGGVLIQWGLVSGTGNTATFTHPVAFADAETEVITFDVQGDTSSPTGASINFATHAAQSSSATKTDVFLVNGTGQVQTATSIFVVVIGKSPNAPYAGDPAFSGFAQQDLTYADGQENKVAPTADLIKYGFFVEIFNMQGNYLNANVFNWLLNDLFEELGFSGSRRSYQPPGYAAPATTTSVRIGRLLIQSGRVTSADLASTGGRIIFDKAFANIPAVHVNQRFTGAVPAVGAASGASYASVVAKTNDGVTITARNPNGSAATGTITFNWFAVGLAV